MFREMIKKAEAIRDHLKRVGEVLKRIKDVDNRVKDYYTAVSSYRETMLREMGEGESLPFSNISSAFNKMVDERQALEAALERLKAEEEEWGKD